MKYEVICQTPDGGNVIEGRSLPVQKKFASLPEAIKEWAKWQLSGPNGPVRSANLIVDGVQVSALQQIEKEGMTPLFYRNEMNGRTRLVDCE